LLPSSGNERKAFKNKMEAIGKNINYFVFLDFSLALLSTYEYIYDSVLYYELSMHLVL
jgi:hypothetical protein